MAIRTILEAKCDAEHCQLDDDRVIADGDNIVTLAFKPGAVVHRECFLKMTAEQFVASMGLVDDVKLGAFRAEEHSPNYQN